MTGILCNWPRGVTVSTRGSESSDREPDPHEASCRRQIAPNLRSPGLYRQVPHAVCFESLFLLFTHREEDEVLVGKVGAVPQGAPYGVF